MKPGKQSIFVDESGRPEVFNRAGANLVALGTTSRYLVIAGVRTVDPQRLAREVALVAPRGTGSPRVLHAVTDSPTLRLKVLTAIAAQEVLATSIVMDKTMLDPEGPWRADRTRFYNEMLAYLLGDCLHFHSDTTIVISRKDFDTQAELDAMGQSITARHREVLGRIARWRAHSVVVSMRSHASSRGLQAADYVAYAVFQAFERGELTYLQAVQPVLGTVWDLARMKRYTRRDPLVSPPT